MVPILLYGCGDYDAVARCDPVHMSWVVVNEHEIVCPCELGLFAENENLLLKEAFCTTESVCCACARCLFASTRYFNNFDVVCLRGDLVDRFVALEPQFY